MTLLEAVNLCLRSTGESNVAALTTGHPYIDTVLSSIDATSKLLQSKGWWFNQSDDRTLTPVGGQIDVSGFTMVVPNRTYRAMHARDGVLYDSRTGDVIDYPVTARVRWEYPTTEQGWQDMPASFTEYAGSAAALEYASNYDADQLQLQKLGTRVEMARTMANADDIRARRVNLYYTGSQAVHIGRSWYQRYGRQE